MNEKRYEVYDEQLPDEVSKLASDMDLNAVFCLIKGYVDTFNQPLEITIKEMKHCEKGD